MTVQVAVYDRVNRERLLGYVDRPAISAHHDYWEVVYIPPLQSPWVVEVKPAPMERIVFQKHWITTDDGWEQKCVCVTATSLDSLLRLRSFRLPGESPETASFRWRYS